MALIEDNLLKSIEEAPNPLLLCMMIVTATELCGSFMTGKIGNKETKDNFLAFWDSNYMPREYHEISYLLYKILRNGVSHSFVAKGGIFPGADKATSNKHLKFLREGVIIYTPKLKEDVMKGILMLLGDLKKNKNNLQPNYRFVLSKLLEDGKREYEKFIEEKNIEILNEKIIPDITLDI